jgi:TRAP-type C4-dicarboxylate transport system permease small subunit
MMQLVARLIAALVGILFALWGGEMMIDAWDYRVAGAPLPQGIMFLPLCLGGTLIAIFSIEQLLRLWQSQSSSAS